LTNKLYQTPALEAQILGAFKNIYSDNKMIVLFSERPFPFRLGWYLTYNEPQFQTQMEDLAA